MSGGEISDNIKRNFGGPLDLLNNIDDIVERMVK
jgi:hypothetical protein